MACHQRRCSLRSSLRRAASSAVRSAFVVRCTSNLDQSVAVYPVDASWYVLRSRWYVSGLRGA